MIARLQYCILKYVIGYNLENGQCREMCSIDTFFSTMLAKTLGSLGKCIDHSSMQLVLNMVPYKEYNYQM